jgi:hypothetical protein
MHGLAMFLASSYSATALAMEPSGHVPCVISIGTSISKASIFRFENYWMDHEQFLNVVQHGWVVPTLQQDAAKVLSAKFKNLRRVLRAWQSQLSNLKANIENVRFLLVLLGVFGMSTHGNTCFSTCRI